MSRKEEWRRSIFSEKARAKEAAALWEAAAGEGGVVLRSAVGFAAAAAGFAAGFATGGWGWAAWTAAAGWVAGSGVAAWLGAGAGSEILSRDEERGSAGFVTRAAAWAARRTLETEVLTARMSEDERAAWESSRLDEAAGGEKKIGRRRSRL